jgi:hypothetical protein
VTPKDPGMHLRSACVQAAEQDAVDDGWRRADVIERTTLGTMNTAVIRNEWVIERRCAVGHIVSA